MPEYFTRLTVRVAFVLYVATVLLLVTRRTDRAAARWLWTIGCAVFLAHVALAFKVFHHWSHAAAYAETARRTAKQFGMNWGGGLYLNYLFTGVWAADVAWWWAAGDAAYHRRPRLATALLHGFMAFMAFNATVVFEHGATRWSGVAATACIVTAWLAHRRAQRSGIERGISGHE